MESKIDRLQRALAYRTGNKDTDNYLFDSGDVTDIRKLDGGRVELDLQLSSQWTDEYRFAGLIHEFGPLVSCDFESGGCDTCGYGSTYVAVLGPKVDS